MPDEQLTPHELAMDTLGYVPGETPETWEDVQIKTQQLKPNIVYINGGAWIIGGGLSLDRIKEIYDRAGVPITDISLPPKNEA